MLFTLWPICGVSKHPWVQVPAGEIVVVIAQLDVMPDVLVTGGGGSVDGLAASLIRHFATGNGAEVTLASIQPELPAA